MDKISFYGLSRSGKSCYIFAMAQALSQGIQFPDGQILTVRTPDPRQMLRLYKAYETMTNGLWPKGSIESYDYNFNVSKALEKLMSFGLTDFRGGLLDSMDEDDEDEQNKLFDSYRNSSVLLFFIGADTIRDACNGDFEANFKIDYLNTLYGNYLDKAQDSKTPIMIVITKSDMLSSQEIEQSKVFVKKKMQDMFGVGTQITAAITAVTLGRNLSNDNGELEGELIIGPTSGNIHIPILYSLYCVMAKKLEEATSNLRSAESSYRGAQRDLSHELSRSAFARFFDDNESSIRSRLSSYNSTISDEKSKLIKINETMSMIKQYLLRGAEVYINGQKQ